MIVSGTGITAFTAKVLRDFVVRTDYSIKWFRTDSGAWRYTKRTGSETYEAVINIYGLKGTIERFVSQAYANRVAGSNVITLTEFESNEKIFGEDVSHTSLSATLLNTPEIKQGSLHGYGCRLELRAIAPTFIGTPAFPLLRYLRTGYTAGIEEYSIKKIDTYEGVYTYMDAKKDFGTFSGKFVLSLAELQGLRRWMATAAPYTVSIAGINGVDTPFGKERPTVYPLTVVVLEVKEEDMFGLDKAVVNIKLGEVL